MRAVAGDGGPGLCRGTFLALLYRWGVPFVLRPTASVTVCLGQQWYKLSHSGGK